MQTSRKRSMKILDETIELEKNSKLLFTDYRQYFMLLVVTALLDAVSTMYFINGVCFFMTNMRS